MLAVSVHAGSFIFMVEDRRIASLQEVMGEHP